ncbi:MAG TPA: hypothetical protein VMT19_00360 [Thermoanaerobaculaceae bacterium]|nr:hypothetical protein [Thermoanaerobaculaceae bacterium]
MRRTLLVAAAGLLALLPPAGVAEDRIFKLECVTKIGDNMYRAKNRTVVWTEHCSHDASCEDVEVRLGSDPRITWHNGEYCWVLKVAER